MPVILTLKIQAPSLVEGQPHYFRKDHSGAIIAVKYAPCLKHDLAWPIGFNRRQIVGNLALMHSLHISSHGELYNRCRKILCTENPAR